MRLPHRKVLRRVRIHQRGERPSLEGLYLGERAGHYVLARAAILESADRTIALESDEVWVPRDAVVFMEVWEGGGGS